MGPSWQREPGEEEGAKVESLTGMNQRSHADAKPARADSNLHAYVGVHAMKIRKKRKEQSGDFMRAGADA